MSDSPYDVQEQQLDKSPSSFAILIDLLTSPKKAFQDIQNSFPVTFPLLLPIILNALLIIVIYSSIDYGWFIEHTVEMQGSELSNAEKDQMRQGMEMMSPSVMGGLGAVAAGIFIALIFCVISLYFVIVSGITNDGYQFKQWLSFVSWTSIPALIGTLASFVTVFTSSNGQIAAESVNPLTLNALFFDLNPAHGLGSILATTDITMIWTLTLMTIGYSVWTKSSTAKSFGIIILPYAAYYGIRFLML